MSMAPSGEVERRRQREDDEPEDECAPQEPFQAHERVLAGTLARAQRRAVGESAGCRGNRVSQAYAERTRTGGEHDALLGPRPRGGLGLPAIEGILEVAD